MSEVGSIKWFRTDLGYGFIRSDFGNDIYLHQKQIVDGVTPAIGSRVQFDLRVDAVRGTYWAKNVRLASRSSGL
ncbi:cold shock CspA family protein [Bradyrhizobium sp. USDA 4341]